MAANIKREQRTSTSSCFGLGDKTCGALGLPEAPVFYPTAQEFGDPLEYIAQIRERAEPYGLCRIVPPKGWDPPFALDLQSFSFPTKLQAIHQLQERPAALNPETFRFEYDKFLESQGRVLESWPNFCGEEMDLCKLYNSVKRHGGYEKVMQQRKWGEVLRMVMPDATPAALSSAAPANLYHLYEKHLLEYETFRNEQKQEAVEQVDSKDANNKRSADGTVVGDLKRLKSADGSVVVASASLQPRPNQSCEQCHSEAHEQMMLVCHRCQRAWHAYCISPPVSAVPSGAWYCQDCVSSDQEAFGFAQGNRHTLDSFRRMCERFKKKWFGGRPVSYADVEQEFWQIVERATGPVEVLYGSDLDTSVFGSGFPRPTDAVPRWAKQELWEAHANSPWNLNNFPKLKGSMLRLVNENIPGVIVPWLYVGMLFSSFCWHYEDHCFYSVNYLHWGEPKCWYSVPGSAYDAFEEVMRSTFPDLFQAQPDLLFQLVTMLNPAVLRENNVPVCTTLQEAGHFVITFPRSYHGGFNHGFNCAEAVNFAPLDWVPFGRFGVERYRLYHKAAVLSHDELLCVVAKNQSSASHWLQNEFCYITEVERAQREELWQSGMVKSCRMPQRSYKNVGKEEDAECIICRYYLHLSAVVCSCRPGKAVCLEHAGQLCECSAEKKCLLYRQSLAELEDLSGSRTDEQKHDARKKKGKGSPGRLQELASTWACKARSALAKIPALNEVEDLVRQAEQFMWAGHEVDSVRQLESVLALKLNWAKDVATCYNAVQERLHGNKSTRIQLAKVNDLLTINPLPCIEPYASKLKPIAKNACNLQKQIGKLFAAAALPEVRMLQRIQQDILRFPLDFPEGQKVQEVLSTAQLWSERVQKHLSAGKGGQKRSDLADIFQLRDLQSQGLKLAVMVPEKRLLDVVVKKVESWLQHARDAFESAPSMQEAEEILSEGEGLPARLPELEDLRKDVLECRSWSDRAQAALNSVAGMKDYAAAVEILKDVVEASKGLRIQVSEMDCVGKTLRRMSWMEQATNVLRSRSSTDAYVKLLDEDDKDDCLLSEIKCRLQAAVAWESKANDALKLGASYEDFSALLSESSCIDVELTGLCQVKSALSSADLWLPQARPAVEYFKNPSDEAARAVELDDLKALVSEMFMSPILLPELNLLRTWLSDLEEWCSQASARERSVNMLLLAESTVLQLTEHLSQLEEFVSQGVPHNAKLSQLEGLQGLIMAIKWTIETLELMSGFPTMESLETQIETGKQLGGIVKDSSAYKRLEEAKNRAKTWHSKVTALIEDFEAKVSARLLDQLLEESQSVIVDCSSEVRQIEQILADHRAWQRDVQKVFDETSTLSLSELLSLQETGEASLLQSMEVELLDTLVVGVGAWLVRCEEAIGTDHSSLREGLLQLKRSAVQALQTVHQGVDEEGVDEEETSCVCLQPLQDECTIVTCSRCKDRYHPSCVGMTHLGPNQQQYTCPFCAALSSGAVFPKDDVTPKINTIRKPSLSCLVELANAAKALRCRVEEEELVENVLDAVFSWQEWAQKFGDSVLSAANEADVDSKLLGRVLKAACIIGVQEESSALVKRAVAVNAWRHRTRKLLNSSGKPCYRSICRAVQEAVSMDVPVTDSLYEEVKKRECEASTWVDLAQKAIEDEGQMPVESVNLLIAQGDELPVTLTREITALRARSVLYCICRKPYDEARGMIGCDRCGEWYHFSCINLPEPENNDGDCDEILRKELGPSGEFFCPSCKKVGKTREVRLPEDGSRSGKAQQSAKKKRSSRPRTRTRSRQQQEQVESQSDSKDSEEDSSDNNNGTKTRPCRRTAGQHSGFDSFVLVKSR